MNVVSIVSGALFGSFCANVVVPQFGELQEGEGGGGHFESDPALTYMLRFVISINNKNTIPFDSVTIL